MLNTFQIEAVLAQGGNTTPAVGMLGIILADKKCLLVQGLINLNPPDK